MRLKNSILSVFLASAMLFTSVPVPAASTVTVTIVDNKNTKTTNDDSKYIVQVEKGSKIDAEELQKIDTWVKQGEGRNEVAKTAYNISLSSADTKALRKKITKNKTFRLNYKQINPVIMFYDTISKQVYSTKVAKKGETVAYPAPPKHDGCTFDDATGWSIKKGTKFKSIKTYTVKANYKQTTYVIQFDGKGATSGKMSQTKNIKYTEKFQLPENQFKKTGYVFKGWKIKGKGAYLYKNKATVSKLTTKDKGVVTFEAAWEKKEEKIYSISYVLGCDPISSNPKTYKAGSKIKIKNPGKDARPGYKFKGWTYGSRTDPVLKVEIRNANMGDITFVAHWEPIIYKIQFKGNKSTSGKMNKLRIRYGIKSDDPTTWVKLPKNQFKKTGYIFDGWSYNGNTYKDEQVIKYNMTTKETTLVFTAKWVEDTKAYTITYNLNGGDDKGKNKTSYITNTKTFKLTNPTRTGYKFAGWTGTGLTDLQKIVSIPKGSSGNKTFTANWTPIEYTIVFSKNHKDKTGEGYMDSITAKFDEIVKLPACGFTRKRYLFDHWEYSGHAIEDMGTVTQLASKSKTKVTLKATWKINPEYECTLNFKLNGGEYDGNTKPNAIYGSKGQTISLQIPTPPKGKRFDHWTCTGNGSINGNMFTFGDGMSNTTATITAVYVKG